MQRALRNICKITSLFVNNFVYLNKIIKIFTKNAFSFRKQKNINISTKTNVFCKNGRPNQANSAIKRTQNPYICITYWLQ
ncbi:hypothetical protein CJI57_00940 [Bifidobacteriaceae bacterium WP012]|nr:hypothetical protein CJI57_00940 [Bifidobacteriaceae bacterium WP012]